MIQPRCRAFFDAHANTALTFNDVRLRTGYSETMPDAVKIVSCFSRNVPLRMPLVSAAMDTVTEAQLALSLAKLGGLGVIHRNMLPKQQAAEVARVKHHLNGLISHPICISGDLSIARVLAMREEKGYTFHSFLVIDGTGKLSGVLTSNDFDFCENSSATVAQVMSRNVVKAAVGTSLQEAYRSMMEHKCKLLPLVTDEGEVAGLYTFSDVNRIVRGKSDEYNVDTHGQLRVGAAIGTGPQALERAELLTREHVDVIVIDTAHADSASVLATLGELKSSFPATDIVVGNISEPESALRLAKAGADGIKVGQGPGSICTTRMVAGVGCPQLTAIYNCAEAIRDSGVPLCADGGIRQTGDIPIAIGAGASSVMLGQMFAGTKEAPGDTIFADGRQWKVYRGMGSLSALLESESSRERYLQPVGKPDALVPEGIESRVPYKGELAQVVVQYIGGLRHGMGYVGAATITELQEKADFRFMTNAGSAESHPHDVLITQKAPNYG